MTMQSVVALALGAMLVLGLGCADDQGTAADAGVGGAPDSGVRAKRRTVRIELWKMAERVLEPADGGASEYGPFVDIGGVEVCVARTRPAFAAFTEFHELSPPLCATSVEGETVELTGVPSNSDLVITLKKPGFVPGTLTFRTDEHDIVGPNFRSSAGWRPSPPRRRAMRSSGSTRRVLGGTAPTPPKARRF
jgi:hypothetical protein